MMAPVRLPLQLGRAALDQGARFAALVWLGPGLLMLAAMVGGGHVLAILALGLAGVIAIAFAVDAASNAKRDRPADILLDAGGFTIDGGPLDKARYAWARVDAARCTISDGEARTAIRWLVLDLLTGRRVPAIHRRVRVRVHRLELRLVGEAKPLVLAEAEHGELDSLEQVRASIRAVAVPERDGSATELPPDVLRCPQCSAPQIPAATSTMSCPFCGHELAVPEELQQRMRAVTELQRSEASRPRLVKALLDQPSARRAGATVAWCRRVMVWFQPGAIALLVALLIHQTGSGTSPDGISVVRDAPSDDGVFFYDLALVVLLIAGVFAIGWSIGHAYVANRQALRALADGFGAVAPTEPGAPSTCRQCAAPLPASTALLVRCVYCSTENVLGIDPRPAARRRHREHADLSHALRKRRRARIWMAVVIPLSAALAFALGNEVRLAWHVPHHTVRGFSPDCTFYGSCGTVTNLDLVRRRVTITAGDHPVDVTILPHGKVSWSCSWDCTLDVGGTRLTPAKGDRIDARIDHGRLRY